MSATYPVFYSCAAHLRQVLWHVVTSGLGVPFAQGPEVRSGDLAEPIEMQRGESYTFTITEGKSHTHGPCAAYDIACSGACKPS